MVKRKLRGEGADLEGRTGSRLSEGGLVSPSVQPQVDPLRAPSQQRGAEDKRQIPCPQHMSGRVRESVAAPQSRPWNTPERHPTYMPEQPWTLAVPEPRGHPWAA